mgnify:CR=1 FL=1
MSAKKLEKLRQHHHATIGLFVAFWLFTLIAIGIIEFFEISERTRDSLIGTIFGGAIVLLLLQFAKRCPKCRANLGWQLRLGIPRHCHKCGAVLRPDP